MKPDDPRHGTTRGYAAGCREACCRRANALYEKRRRLNAVQGIALAVPALGAQRRIQALMALGWTTTDIAHACGWTHRNHLAHITIGQKGKACRWVTRTTHDTLDRVYRELGMTIPEMTHVRRRSRDRAVRLGYASPLAWDNIDDPDERPVGLIVARDREVDPIVVDRLLLCDRSVFSTPAEKAEALRRWIANGGSERDMCIRMGWKQGRYKVPEVAA